LKHIITQEDSAKNNMAEISMLSIVMLGIGMSPVMGGPLNKVTSRKLPVIKGATELAGEGAEKKVGGTGKRIGRADKKAQKL